MPDEPVYKKLERRCEEIHEEMYGTSAPHGLLSEIKECFEVGEPDEGSQLRQRLDQIVTVYRRQFT